MVKGPGAPWSHWRLRSPWGPGVFSAVWRQQSEHLPHGAVWGLNMAWKVRGGAWLIPSTKHLDFNCCYYSERRECSERVFIYSYKKLCVCVCMHMPAQSCLTLRNPMDCSLPGSSVQGTFQARILEGVANSFSRGSSWPMDWTRLSYVSCIGRWVLYY